MDELLINSNDAYKPMSDDALKMITEQGNVEAIELLELTDKVLSDHWLRYVSSTGHVCCDCGRALPLAINGSEIKSQVGRLTGKR